MKSTPARAVRAVRAVPAVPATMTEYTHTLGNDMFRIWNTHTLGNGMFHIWNIRSSSRSAAAATAIEDFYIHENMSSTNPKQNPHTQINKSFPRHHALVCASLDSTRVLIARRDTGGVCRKRYTNDDARTTVYQKHHLVSMSGLAGLLIARWTGVTVARAHTIKTAKKHAELTAKYTHSTLACEILVGNRYYRDLPRVLASSSSSLSSSSSNIIGNYNSTNLTPADVTPESVAATKTELLETYTAQIDRLLHAVAQYKRGFVGLQTIRSDPEFTRMMCAYWRYCKQLMKIHRNFEENRDDDDYDGDSDGECFVAAADETFATRRFFVSADVCAVSAMVPQLYNYDIVHLFDGATQGYAKFVKIARHTLVRLSNDGLTAAFLSFAAIEPRMVTAEMAPKHGTKYVTTSLPSCANHIPSRDPLYGALRVLHRALIPRTADAVNAVNAVNADIQGIPRLPPSIRNVRNYSPLYDTLENIRAGRRQGTTPMISSATRAYTERRTAAAATEAAAEAADGWTVVCSRRKRK